MYARFDGAQRTLECVCDLFVTHPLQVAKGEHISVMWRESIEGVADNLGGFASDELFMRGRLFGRYQFFGVAFTGGAGDDEKNF